jgi:hypothetical protein
MNLVLEEGASKDCARLEGRPQTRPSTFETLGAQSGAPAPQDEVGGFKLHPSDPIGFMESICVDPQVRCACAAGSNDVVLDLLSCCGGVDRLHFANRTDPRMIRRTIRPPVAT